MPGFHIKRKRKVAHRLMFDQKSWNDRLPFHERMALFVREQPIPSHCAVETKKECTVKKSEGLPSNACLQVNDSDTKRNQ